MKSKISKPKTESLILVQRLRNQLRARKAELDGADAVIEKLKRRITNPVPHRLEAARMASNRLHARIEGERIIISIGVETLAFAAEECDGNPKVKILDAKQLALDAIFELVKEDEVGASKLTDLFDDAVNAAMENGSVAFADSDNCRNKS